MRSAVRRAVMVVVCCLTVTTACGGGATTNSDSRDYQLVENDKLTFGMSGQYRPFNYYGQSGKLAGFDVDLGSEVAERLDLTPNPVTGPFNSLVAGLKAKRYDLIIGSMSPTPERKKQVDFTNDYYVSGAQLFVGNDSSVTSVAELQKATVGVVLGTTFEDYAKKQPGIAQVKTYSNDNEVLTDLANGRIDAAITTKLLGLYQIKQTHLKIKPVGPVLFPDPAAIAGRKDNSELTAEVNQALAAIKDDGTYAKLSEKWFGVDISQDSPS